MCVMEKQKKCFKIRADKKVSLLLLYKCKYESKILGEQDKGLYNKHG